MGMEITSQGGAMGAGSAMGAKPNPKAFFDNLQPLPEERFRQTPTGLRVAVVREGTGKEATQGMTLKVDYSGWLKTGEKFDSSTDKGEPFSFTLGAGNVIKGWEEGLLGMKVGERRQLVVPAELAYGQRQVGQIPPGSTLVFNVELTGVEDNSRSPYPAGTVSILA